MNQLEQASREALDVLVHKSGFESENVDYKKAESSIYEAISILHKAIATLAQQEKPEPVYFRWVIHGEPIDTIFKVKDLPDKDTLQKWKINGRDVEYLYTQPPRRRDEPQEKPKPVEWIRGGLVTVNQDNYPNLGQLFVQFWDGDDVVARVYANDKETLERRCRSIEGKQVTSQPPRREWVGMTEEQINKAASKSEVHQYHPGAILEFAREIETQAKELNT